jgi:hypothetical protein
MTLIAERFACGTLWVASCRDSAARSISRGPIEPKADSFSVTPPPQSMLVSVIILALLSLLVATEPDS